MLLLNCIKELDKMDEMNRAGEELEAQGVGVERSRGGERRRVVRI